MSRPKARPRVDHQHVADQARQMPEQWVFASTYNSSSSAGHAAARVRNPSDASMRHYHPPGAFEARTELTDDGADLYVRYVAEAPTPGPEDGTTRDFRQSVDSGLTEGFDAFSHRLDSVITDGARRNRC